MFYHLPLEQRANKFISKSKATYGDRFSYDKVVYINRELPVIIECRLHGEFYVTPNKHRQGKGGCKSCPTAKRIGITDRVKRDASDIERYKGTKSYERLRQQRQDAWKKHATDVHDDRFNYDDVNFVLTKTTVNIQCIAHGTMFRVSAAAHLKMIHGGCRNCFLDNAKFQNLLSQEEWMQQAIKVHGTLYDYSLVQYKGWCEKIIIICKKHGNFSQKAGVHLSGSGCQTCNSSKLEKGIAQALESKSILFTKESLVYTMNHIDPTRRKGFFDFFGEYNGSKFCIEGDGGQHFKFVEYYKRPLEETIRRDRAKDLHCLENHIHILHISYKEIKDVSSWIESFFETITTCPDDEVVFMTSNAELYQPVLKLLYEKGPVVTRNYLP